MRDKNVKLLMEKFEIITNNPLVQAKHDADMVFHAAAAGEILKIARDRVHKGARLLNHPLSGGVLPGVCPYKSLIVTETVTNGPVNTDIKSLRLIESALEALQMPPEGFKGYDSKTLEDYKVLDLDMLDSALMSLNLH